MVRLGMKISVVMLLVTMVVTPTIYRILLVGSGYGAKVACSAVWTAGRDWSLVLRDEFAAFPPLPVWIINNATFKGAGSGLLGIERIAVYDKHRESCVLLPHGETTALALQVSPSLPPLTTSSNDDVSHEWPQGSGISSESNRQQAIQDGVNVQMLDAIIDEAFAHNHESGKRTRAIVVVHHGRIIAERYAEIDGITASTRLTGWSMSKAVLSTITGVSINEGRLKLNQDNLMPQWRHLPNDPRAKITLDQLLRMSSGLEFEEKYNPWNENPYMLFAQRDVADYSANKPLQHAPDTHWSYSSATTNLISAILRETFVNESISSGGVDDAEHDGLLKYWQYPYQTLFNVIGMNSAVFDSDAHGTLIGSSFVWATARDWARFGLLHLQNGKWNGKQVLPEWWVKYAVTSTVPTNAEDGYGAQWWLNYGGRLENAPRNLYQAKGFEEQTVSVLPDHDLVVVRLGCTHPDHAWPGDAFMKNISLAIPLFITS